MASYHRPSRPAATDYFNPTEQLELLQTIAEKLNTTPTSTLQESTNILAPVPAEPADSKPPDFKAHELTLREKLEKAKAERDAKAKADAAINSNPMPTTPATPNLSNENVKSHPDPALPPFTLNVQNPMPAPGAQYNSGWTSSSPFPQPSPMYPPYPPQFPSYSQSYASQFGVPYPPGQTTGPFPQSGTFPPTPPTPGVQNQGPQQNQKTSAAANQTHPNQVNTSQLNPNSQGQKGRAFKIES